MEIPKRSPDASVKDEIQDNEHISVWLEEGVLSLNTFTKDFKVVQNAYKVIEINNIWFYESGNNWHKINHPNAKKAIKLAIEKVIEKALLE